MLTPRTHIRIPMAYFVNYVGEGLIGTGMVQNFSGDGWHITAIESQPIKVGMSLAFRVTLPNQPTPITVEATTVQWVRRPEFGVHVVSMNSKGEAGSAHRKYAPENKELTGLEAEAREAKSGL